MSHQKSDEHSTKQDVVQSGAMLDTWAQDPWVNGIQIDKLPTMQHIHVQTRDNLYEITVIDGSQGAVLIKGGTLMPEFREAHLEGATLGGSFCKMRGIYPGFNIEFLADGLRFTTSTVLTVAVFDPQ